MANKIREAGAMQRPAQPPEVVRHETMRCRRQAGTPLFKENDAGSNGAIKGVTIGGSGETSNAAVDAKGGRSRKVCFRLAPTKLAERRRRNTMRLRHMRFRSIPPKGKLCSPSTKVFRLPLHVALAWNAHFRIQTGNGLS